MPQPTISKVFRIRRYDPARDRAPRWQDYRLDCDPMERVLTALNRIKWTQDGSLSYRRSCGHAVCGSCAMTIQGSSRLACKTLVKDIPEEVITVEPLKAFPVIKDLVVDMEPFYRNLRAVMPYLVNRAPPPVKERRQSPAQFELIDDASKCILCGACTSSCPSFWKNEQYLGPAALLKAWRFLGDSRDDAKDERIAAVNGRNGVWRCHTIFNCKEACPKDIDIPAALSQLKRAVVFGSVA
ncbi:MAG: succinate dehydrogenase iron-sulfur subunit [Planctomycetota bacterium]|nr:succinate dehydrogenase iron-sulfur subunit [Planctomycetota bacterium]MCX8039614.1 succinate dehydrogenase iron-sulfur subunit [Planctomycetota bacterium]MDW8373091.1 succinate dehydrogenase iron-sulfur subunit [Planctomycetota bacterium]